MAEEKKDKQFPASPQSGWVQPEKALPSPESTKNSSSKKTLLIGGIFALLIIIAIPIGLLLAKKLAPKLPGIYNISTCNDPCRPGQARSWLEPDSSCGSGTAKYTKFCSEGCWSKGSKYDIKTCEPYPHQSDDYRNNNGGNNSNGSSEQKVVQSSDICCSGTPECISAKGNGWRCVRQANSGCESGSVCKYYGGDPSACSSNNDCAAWEVCEGGHCKSKAGCTQDSDCADNAKCVNGTCQGVTGTIECYADGSGVRIVNKTNKTISGSVSWFASWCKNDKACGYCGGGPNNESVTLAPNQSWSRGFTNSEDKSKGICDWQTDINASLGAYHCQQAATGCDQNCSLPTPTPTPTPTIPPNPTSCHLVTITKINGRPYNNQTISPEDVLTLRGEGYTDINKTVDKIYFTIFKGSSIVDEGVGSNLDYTVESNKKHYSAVYNFTVPSYGNYSVSIAVHSPQDGWFCTN